MRTYPTALASLLAFFVLAAPAAARENTFSVRGDEVLLNGKPFKVIGLRCSNALMSDATTQQLISGYDEMAASQEAAAAVPKNILPPRFADPNASGLTAMVVEGENTYDFKIDG